MREIDLSKQCDVFCFSVLVNENSSVCLKTCSNFPQDKGHRHKGERKSVL